MLDFMNILQVNKYFHPFAGVESYYFSLFKLLQKNGHQVAAFAMEDGEAIKIRWQKFFVSRVDYNGTGIREKLKFLTRMFYSREAGQKISALIKEFKPDIVHLHSIYHHLSPAIIPVIKSYGIPIVQHLHDFHLVSPNYNLFHQGQICEASKVKKYYRAVIHRCVKNSYLASAAEAAEKYFQLLSGWEYKLIDYFIVPSNFMKMKLKEYGIDESKVAVIPHFIDHRQYRLSPAGGEYLLYFGRLCEEKGVEMLLNVALKLPHLKIKIAGRGPLETKITALIRRKNISNVELVGFLHGRALKKIIENSRLTVLPSVWYEVFGLSILESFACGKPVVASDIGGIPEIVRHQENGLLFRPGDLPDALNKIRLLIRNSNLLKKMGVAARNTVVYKYNSRNHYENIIKLYSKVINK